MGLPAKAASTIYIREDLAGDKSGSHFPSRNCGTSSAHLSAQRQSQAHPQGSRYELHIWDALGEVGTDGDERRWQTQVCMNTGIWLECFPIEEKERLLPGGQIAPRDQCSPPYFASIFCLPISWS